MGWIRLNRKNDEEGGTLKESKKPKSCTDKWTKVANQMYVEATAIWEKNAVNRFRANSVGGGSEMKEGSRRKIVISQCDQAMLGKCENKKDWNMRTGCPQHQQWQEKGEQDRVWEFLKKKTKCQNMGDEGQEATSPINGKKAKNAPECESGTL